MKQYLLTLLSAALVAGSAAAQVAGPKALSTLKAKAPVVCTSKVATATDTRLGNFKFDAGQKHTMADETSTKRNAKELSWQVYGDEIDNVGIYPTNIGLEDVKYYGFTGIGYAAAFPTVVTERFAGNTIGRINFVAWLGKYTDAKVFVATLNNNGYFNELWSQPVTVKTPTVSKEGFTPQVTSVNCDYVIPDTLTSDLYIGWVSGSTGYDSNDQFASQYGIVMTGYPDYTNTGYGALMVASSGQDDAVAFAGTSCNAPIWAQTTGNGGLLANDAAIFMIDDARSFSGKKGYARLSIASMGTDSINSLEYTVENGGETKTYSVDFTGQYGLQYMTQTQLNLPIDMPATAGRSNAKITVTKVNGVADEYTEKTENEGPLPVISLPAESYRRTPVFEELTSTGCTWCPYGIAAFNQLADSTDASKSVKVAIHGNFGQIADPLTCSDYDSFFNYFGTSLPTVLLNREVTLHPSVGLVEPFKYINSQPCEASLSVTGSNGLAGPNIKTTVKFNIDVPAQTYALAYVLTEDGITGVDQVNGFATVYYMYKNGQQKTYQSMIDEWKDDPYLWPLATAKYSVKNQQLWSQFEMNHIARAFSEAGENEAGILPALSAGQEWTDSYNLKWPKNLSPAVNKNNCSVAVYLVDAATGKIVTGCQTKLGETNTSADTMTGINNVTVADNGVDAQISTIDGAFVVKAQNATAKVFDAQGRLVSSATVDGEVSLPTFGTGVFIIRVDQAGHSTTQKAVF